MYKTLKWFQELISRVCRNSNEILNYTFLVQLYFPEVVKRPMTTRSREKTDDGVGVDAQGFLQFSYTIIGNTAAIRLHSSYV